MVKSYRNWSTQIAWAVLIGLKRKDNHVRDHQHHSAGRINSKDKVTKIDFVGLYICVYLDVGLSIAQCFYLWTWKILRILSKKKHDFSFLWLANPYISIVHVLDSNSFCTSIWRNLLDPILSVSQLTHSNQRGVWPRTWIEFYSSSNHCTWTKIGSAPSTSKN